MTQRPPLSSELEAFLTLLEGEDPNEQLHIYIEPDRVTLVRETPEVVESTPPPPPPRDRKPAVLVRTVMLLLFVAVVLVARFVPAPTRRVSFPLSILGVALAPVQQQLSVTVPATGNGFIPATTATGTITFYNGQLYTQILPAGTILKGRDGVDAITDVQAVIPPAAETTPPTYGQASVPAHAITPGAGGNIGAGDINQACCVTSVIAQNPAAFTGGRNAERYTFVTTQDVTQATAPLLARLDAQVPQLFDSERVLAPHCTGAVSATPLVGQRAEQVQVRVTVTCTPFSYDPHIMQAALQSYSTRLGRGTLTQVTYLIVTIDKRDRLFLLVTATWNPLIVVGRHV